MLSKLFALIFFVMLAITAYYSLRFSGTSDNNLMNAKLQVEKEVVTDQKVTKQGITIENFWLPSVPEVAKNAAAYGNISNNSAKTDTLMGVGSDIALITELHETKKMPSGFWGMEHIPSVNIEPGAKLSLKPMSYHVMLVDLTEKIKSGTQVNLWFEFENAGRIDIQAPVLELAE